MYGPFIGVIGAGSCSDETASLACQVGGEIARRGGVLVCGGLGGVMQAAARGAKEFGGLTVGILPGPSVTEANPYIDVPVATNMGQARNAIIVQTVQALIAVAGGFGTLSEMALALKIGKTVVTLWPQFDIAGVRRVETAQEAMDVVLQQLIAG
ncbi:MAG TPA: TIGR00725 family protein [Syntrophobacteraceae bacterium]|nr:TIGR00725 family protein [Syntrophobacteraceae bacterium]HBZ54025.1 TIGR00725 family protein [Syntrophobacteraceae bacterium]